MKVLVAGDFCPQNRVTTVFEKEEYSSVFRDVKEIITEADYSIVNFECPITKGGEKPIHKNGPNLQCSEKGVKAIKWAGFDCVTLANNHVCDFGGAGVFNTIEECEKHGIDWVGGGRNLEEASQILYKKINGKVLAVINCCEHEFSIATDTAAGSNPLSPIQQYYSIKEARKNADYILVIVHGGPELFQLPSLRMVETYRFFIDAGADAVVNHHQHCYSGYEEYHNKPIFYGLGNFCFDKPNKRNGKWNEGFLLVLNFCESTSFEIVPYQQCSEKAEITILAKNAFEIEIEKLNTLITDHNKLRLAIDKYYSSCAKQYSDIFEPIINRYYLACKHRGYLPSLISYKRKLKAENYICCESHRDKLTWWLCK
jgi:poly-gamma-glutamate synthesis protein (capsule biosynthesis protein)